MQKRAFTLVELIVGMTISMLLMVSVGILLSSGVQNILKQEKIISQSTNFGENISALYKNFENITGEKIFSSQSGVLFRVKQNINTGGFGYIGSIEKTGDYCPIDSENPTTQHLVWKNFIPYEEIGEDFLDDYYQTQFSETGNFRVDTKNHQVLENNTRIIGGESFGHKFENGANGTDILLNTPTAILEAEGGLFVSDTLNHRVLFYKDGKISLVLDHYDGLVEPTGLAYENGNLYIANSGKGEILKYSSEIYANNPNLEILYTPENNHGTFNRLEISFTGSSFTPTGPTATGSFSFDENYISQDEDFTRIHNNKLQYFFSDFSNSSSIVSNGNIPSCTSSTQYNVTTTNNVEKIQTNCISSNTGSIIRYTGNTNFTLSNGNDYEISLGDISPQISGSGNYLAEITFFENNTQKNKKLFHYFTQGTGKVSDGKYNTLELFTENLSYPTGISINGSNLVVNDSIDRKQYNIDLVTQNISENIDLEDFSESGFAQLDFNEMTDIYLEFPLKNLEISYDTTNQYLGGVVEYYQFLNCYNPDETIEKSFLFGKNMK